VEAMTWLRTHFCDARHLVCELPSVDREDSGVSLLAHKAWFMLDVEVDDEGSAAAATERAVAFARPV